MASMSHAPFSSAQCHPVTAWICRGSRTGAIGHFVETTGRLVVLVRKGRLGLRSFLVLSLLTFPPVSGKLSLLGGLRRELKQTVLHAAFCQKIEYRLASRDTMPCRETRGYQTGPTPS